MCGPFKTENRNIYSCGNNDYGQLGQQKSQSRPSRVEGLEQYEIFRICCGDYFSLALTDDGKVFGWGRNNSGQLCEQSEEVVFKPSLLKELSNYKIVQIGALYQLYFLNTKRTKKYYYHYSLYNIDYII